MSDHLRRDTLLVGICVLALVTAACGGHHRDGETTRRSSPVRSAGTSTWSSSPTSFATAQRAAVAAWRAMWADDAGVVRTPDGNVAMLRRHATGRALALLRKGVRSDRRADVITEGHLVLHPRVAKLTPRRHARRVEIRDCVDDSHWLDYDARSRHRRRMGPSGRRRAEAVVTQTHGGWKVSAFFVEKPGMC